jgi:hypothetical protein
VSGGVYDPPHPLAERLAAALHGRPTRVLVWGPGDGRNSRALRAAGALVEELEADADPARGARPYDAVLSTHALLHGTTATVAARLAAISGVIAAGGSLYATLGSTADARCGRGTRVAGGSGWAPVEGPEAGVAHAFFDAAGVAAALGTAYELRWMEERDVRAVVGRWAHPLPQQEPLVHWLIEARRRFTPPATDDMSSTAPDPS